MQVNRVSNLIWLNLYTLWLVLNTLIQNTIWVKLNIQTKHNTFLMSYLQTEGQECCQTCFQVVTFGKFLPFKPERQVIRLPNNSIKLIVCLELCTDNSVFMMFSIHNDCKYVLLLTVDTSAVVFVLMMFVTESSWALWRLHKSVYSGQITHLGQNKYFIFN